MITIRWKTVWKQGAEVVVGNGPFIAATLIALHANREVATVLYPLYKHWGCKYLLHYDSSHTQKNNISASTGEVKTNKQIIWVFPRKRYVFKLLQHLLLYFLSVSELLYWYIIKVAVKTNKTVNSCLQPSCGNSSAYVRLQLNQTTTKRALQKRHICRPAPFTRWGMGSKHEP